MKQNVIVIGAGIGGLATAIRLAKKGYGVTVYEKNSQPGGRCQRIVRDGHVFDTGPTMFIFPRMYEQFFTDIGEDMHAYMKLIRTDPTYRLNFPDNTHLTLTSDLKRMRKQLEKLEPGSYPRFLEYLKLARAHSDIALGRIINKDLTNPIDYFNPKNFILLLRHKALMNHYPYVKTFFSHPHLAIAFTFQDAYLSLNPFRDPAIYSLFTYNEIRDGNFLPEGGMYEVIRTLAAIAGKYGVKTVYKKTVKKINIRNSQATGVTFEDGSSATGDCIVANCDMSYAYNHLIPREPFAGTLLKKEFSCSAIVYHWGVKKRYPQLLTHNMFFSEPYRDGFDHVTSRTEPPAHPHFYIQAPARTDPTRAPVNQDTISVMVPINRIYPDHPVDWKAYSGRVREFVFERLGNAGLGDLRKQIKFEVTYMPTDWRDHQNLTYGAVYGLHHNLAQLGYLRPHRRHKRYGNLYFVGADTHPGNGLPCVLASSGYTSDRISGHARR